MHRVKRRPSYQIIPKGKRLAGKVVEKLERDNYHYAIARAMDAANRLEEKKRRRTKSTSDIRKSAVSAAKTEEKEVRKSMPTTKGEKQEKSHRLAQRAEKRRKLKEAAIKDELRRKKYRIHPDELYHVYLKGYTKKRHRITKKRFMQCVDVPLFQKVLFLNEDLLESPIWDDNLDIHNLTFARARVLKDHLQQFEVLVEALKQGIFDKPGCDDLPIEKIRRKRNVKKRTAEEQNSDGDQQTKTTEKSAVDGTAKSPQNSQQRSKKIRDKYKPKAKYQMRASVSESRPKDLMKRRLTYPKYVEEVDVRLPTKSLGWWEKIDTWLHQPAPDADQDEPLQKEDDKGSIAEPNGSDINVRKDSLENEDENKDTDDNSVVEVGPVTPMYGRRKSVTIAEDVAKPNKSGLTTELGGQAKDNQGLGGEYSARRSRISLDSQLSQKGTRNRASRASINLRKPKIKQNNQFGKYLTLAVPYNLGKKQKFLYNLIEKRKKNAKGNVMHKKKTDNKKPPHVPKYDPLQRLHEDEKESDVWTITTTTTTNSYASWRRPPHVDKRKLDDEEDWTETDRTFICRIILVLIVMWEASYFVEKQLDNVYYNVFSSHLYRENIWPVRPGLRRVHIIVKDSEKFRLESVYQYIFSFVAPGLIPPLETYLVLHAQEWSHFIISVISMSIIHKENNCVALLFAFSLLMDGVFKVGFTTADSLFLPHPVSWSSVALNALHLVWKALIISLFVAYHFYSADYIRKTREFSHRKTKLHNHEINVKGTKGLQKRKLAWDWMVHHARKTNLRALRKKYPDVTDGNFPSENLAKDIRFDEAKELRIYAQEHNLNIGYPYNKLRDMKRYVFGELEKSDYSSYNEERQQKRARTLEKRRSRAYQGLTVEKYEEWKSRNKGSKRRPSLSESAKSDGRGAGRPARGGLNATALPTGGFGLTIKPNRNISGSLANLIKGIVD